MNDGKLRGAGARAHGKAQAGIKALHEALFMAEAAVEQHERAKAGSAMAERHSRLSRELSQKHYASAIEALTEARYAASLAGPSPKSARVIEALAAAVDAAHAESAKGRSMADALRAGIETLPAENRNYRPFGIALG